MNHEGLVPHIDKSIISERQKFHLLILFKQAGTQMEDDIGVRLNRYCHITLTCFCPNNEKVFS